MLNVNDKLISVILATKNPNVEYLIQALDSIAGQTIPLSYLEIIIVNDASIDIDSVEYLEKLGRDCVYNGVDVRVITMNENVWLAEARNIGVSNSNAEFICFLDDDDYYQNDYLKKLMITLLSSPGASWAYARKVKFGQISSSTDAIPFNPVDFIFKCHSIYSSMFRRMDWLRVKQRKIVVNDNVNAFEDWDSIIRLIGKGRFGVAVNDTALFYRKSIGRITSSRTPLEFAASMYLVWRKNMLSILFLPYTAIRHIQFMRRGYARSSLFDPITWIDRAIGKIIFKKAHLPYIEGAFTWKILGLAIFRPDSFVKQFTTGLLSMSAAELRAGFKGRIPTLSWNNIFRTTNKTNTVFCVNTFWAMGGGENIYLAWIKNLKEAGAGKIVNIVEYGQGKNEFLKSDYSAECDEQIALDKIANTPLQRLLFCWNMVCIERPRLIFISGNSHFYVLVKQIKETFPEIRIIDILHNEFENTIDHFDAAHDHQKYIDERIVTSDYWKKTLVSKHGESDERVTVCRNSINLERFDQKLFIKDKERKKLRIKTEDRVVCFVGRLHTQKNPLLFLEVARQMEEINDYHFMIIGDGELRSIIEKSAKKAHNVTYVGCSRNVARYIAASDIMLSTSMYEGNPLISIEAAAMNLPIVAPNIVGFSEQIEEGKFGVLYEPTCELMSDAIQIKEIIITKYDELKEMGKNGRKYAEKYHSTSVVYPQYVEVLRRQLEYQNNIDSKTQQTFAYQN